ncbi:MAG TPA: hypothetical protein DEA43_00465 [Candidatus Moranbacteria bacterium]|nr:hypothetical protein [Candidatus Moranbacteria bacterium]HBT45345.1 hypothetical protein [Candidatus Moranbacteria bacterium]
MLYVLCYMNLMYNQTQNQNQAENKIRESVFSKMMRAGSKNYFFDVKKASNGSNYLTITDSYKNQKGENVTSRAIIFKDHIQDFLSNLQEAGTYLK